MLQQNDSTMNQVERYKKFLDEIGWDEFNNVEKQYFFDDLDCIPNDHGIILRISQDNKKNFLVITHKETKAKLVIQLSEIKNFKKWLESEYANNEDGSSYFAWRAAIEKEDRKEVVYEYDVEQRVLTEMLSCFAPRYISREVTFTGSNGTYRADFVVYGADNEIKLIVEAKASTNCNIDNFKRLHDRLQSVNKEVVFILTDGEKAIYSNIGEEIKEGVFLELIQNVKVSKETSEKITFTEVKEFLKKAINSIKTNIKSESEKQKILKKFIEDIRLGDLVQDEKDKSSWYFSKEKEREFFKKLLGEYHGEYILKFTSERSLYTLIDKETIGMSSLICMNDPGEKDYADNKVNKNKSIDNNYADTFIISGCKEEAERNLTMWRLYGGDAKGVCLKFWIDQEKLNKNGFYLAPVSYSKQNKEHFELEIVRNICAQIDGKSLRFDFLEWNIWKHFFKDYMYSVEEEIRLLFIPTQYIPISESVWFVDDRTKIYTEAKVFDLSHDTAFPLTLNRIILGTNFPEYQENTPQFNRRLSRTSIRTKGVKRHELVSHCDDIKNYRS